jgi:phosphoribosylformylglycinamidine synthase
LVGNKYNNMTILHYYRKSPSAPTSFISTVKTLLPPADAALLTGIERETVFNVSTTSPLSPKDLTKLEWLMSETFEKDLTRPTSPFVTPSPTVTKVLEFGPRLTFCSAFSSNACEICLQCGIPSVDRFERSLRYGIVSSSPLSPEGVEAFKAAMHDRMTEMIYPDPIESFDAGVTPAPVTTVPIMEEGKSALEAINASKGLGFDEWDLDYYTDLFVKKLGRNPTDVECFDMGQSNSEHSRHWFFGGKMIIDGEEKEDTLFRMVKDTLKTSNDNSVIAFHDNSSAIKGYDNVPFMKVRILMMNKPPQQLFQNFTLLLTFPPPPPFTSLPTPLPPPPW